MIRELYEKMTDDERLQFISNLRDCRETLLNCLNMQNERIELYKQLLNANESYAYYEGRRCNANERYLDYTDKLFAKYDLKPIHIEGEPIGLAN